MSYDIYLCDPVSGSVAELDFPHQMKGGTYAIGGTQQAHVNVTYNYSRHFYRVIGEGGIRSIYGLSGAESLPILDRAIHELGNDTDSDYWKPTEGNAKQALISLRALATLRPDCVWKGD